jgi:cell division septal protein FtsQ
MLKFLVKLVLLILAVALGRYAYEKVIDLPIFELKKIDLRGNSAIAEDSISALCGFEPGRSIYRQNLNFALSKLSAHRGVAECSVERGYFSGIVIRIDMAEPALLIKGDSLYCLSREGIILPFDSSIPVLPLVTGKKFSGIRCYDRLNDPDVAYALELYGLLMAASPALCARLSEINFVSGSALRIYLSPEGTVALLDKRDFADAVRRLAVLEENGILEGSRIFDFRFGPVAIESSFRKGTL